MNPGVDVSSGFPLGSDSSHSEGFRKNRGGSPTSMERLSNATRIYGLPESGNPRHCHVLQRSRIRAGNTRTGPTNAFPRGLASRRSLPKKEGPADTVSASAGPFVYSTLWPHAIV